MGLSGCRVQISTSAMRIKGYLFSFLFSKRLLSNQFFPQCYYLLCLLSTGFQGCINRLCRFQGCVLYIGRSHRLRVGTCILAHIGHDGRIFLGPCHFFFQAPNLGSGLLQFIDCCSQPLLLIPLLPLLLVHPVCHTGDLLS